MRIAPLFVLPLALAGACADPSADLADPVAEGASAVIAGDFVDPSETGHVALMITPTAACSSTLLRNDWLITAKHCISAGHVATPSTLGARMAGQYTVAEHVYPHPTRDVALVHLSQPLAMGGVTGGYEAPLYAGAITDLVGENLDCFGYGNFTATDDHQGADPGILHHALLPVFTALDSILSVQTNARGQILSHGDSGGGCFFGGSLVSVASRADSPDISGVMEVAIPYVRSWIDQVVPAVQPPGAPQLDFLSFEEGIQLTWLPVPGALSYRVRRQPGNKTDTLVGDSSAFYTDHLAPDTNYTFEVCALNGHGQACGTLLTRTDRRNPIPLPRASAPTDVRVKMLPLENNIIWPFEVSWTKDILARRYEVERRQLNPKSLSAGWNIITFTHDDHVVVRSIIPEYYQFRVCAVGDVNRVCSPPTTKVEQNGSFAQTGNLLGDSGFESQFVIKDERSTLQLPWRSEGPLVTIDGARDSQRILIESGGVAGRWRGVTQTVDVLPHTTYTLTANVRTNAVLNGTLGARDQIGERAIVIGSFGSPSERLVKAVFDSGDSTQITIFVGFTASGATERMAIDDVSLDQT